MSNNKRTTSISPSLYFFGGVITTVLVFVLGAAIVFAALEFGMFPGQNTAEMDSSSLYEEAWRVIAADFFGEIPPETLRTYGAIRGSMEALNDPYSYFVEPEPAERDQEQLQGHFGGIGSYLELQEDGRILLRPMIGRPAQQAGLLEGDILVAVDGDEVPIPADLDEITDRIRGPIGTTVLLTVLRGETILDFDVERQQIELPTVNWRRLEQAQNIAIIEIDRFSALTEDELGEALQDLLEGDDALQAIILDLRGNPGGLLQAAVDVSDAFLDGGPVLIERESDGSEKTYAASSGTTIDEIPLFILVDAGTASAAEIVAGALQDRGRGLLAGQNTYGKGSIQRVHRLSDESAVHVTFARWYTPNDRLIDGQGLAPDLAVEIADNNSDNDAVLQAVLDYLGVVAQTP